MSPSALSTPSSPVATASATSSPQREKSPIILTPRSKVAAMLAALGDDSEDEDLSITTKSRVLARPNALGADMEDEDEEDIVVAKPRGRMAARMMGGEDSEEEVVGAYERVKRTLFENTEDSGEEKEEAPVKTRRRILRKSTPQKNSTPVSRRSSPGLFVSPSVRGKSPSPSQDIAEEDEDSDLPSNPLAQTKNAAFQKLVEEARRKRLAKEEEERAKKAARALQSENLLRSDETAETDSGSDGGNIRRKLTQQARPTRKAGKKAMEEMNRETQRMKRNMQLAHQTKTRKKFTKGDLFKAFNFKQDKAQPSSSSPVRKGAASSDAEAEPAVLSDTPPTSPPPECNDYCDLYDLTPKKSPASKFAQENPGSHGVETAINMDADADLPTSNEIMSTPVELEAEVKVPIQDIIKDKQLLAPAKRTSRCSIRIISQPKPARESQQPDYDDDLEIVGIDKPSRFAIFDKIPSKKTHEARTMITLRALAQLSAPDQVRSRDGRTSLSFPEMQNNLQRRAREQAVQERQEKIAELRAKGIIVQTEEEKEKDLLMLENMLDRARREAAELAKKEKGIAKKEGGEAAEHFMDDSEDDEDYVESEPELAEIELSGSEDEDGDAEDEAEDEDVDEDENAEAEAEKPLFDNEAGESGNGEDIESAQEGIDVDVEASDEERLSAPAAQRRKPRQSHVILDDEDDEETGESSATLPPATPVATNPMAAFGFAADTPAPIGLTQMFQGTMAESQSQPQSQVATDSQEDSLAFLRDIPAPTLPEFTSQDWVVRDSQVSPSKTQGSMFSPLVNLGLSQFQMQPLDSQLFSPSKFSEVPDPTQDMGFQTNIADYANLAESQVTVDTVMMESPTMKKKGKLQRRTVDAAVMSDVDEVENSEEEGADAISDVDDFELKANAFTSMKRAAKKLATAEEFDKRRSRAKEMFQEQAEESEDEYAGLGGASDDESVGEADEEMKAMIDESEVKVDEGKLAAFYADKERAADEKRIDKLYKDITTGALRRKRGADFDELDDEDFDAAERRRQKQREFAKQRRALLEDGNISKIAENPKKQAFFRSLEDRPDDEDLDFLDEGAEFDPTDSVPDSQEESTDPAVLQPLVNPPAAALNLLKRKSTGDAENRPPPHLRRTAAVDAPRKRATLAEVRESISFLIDEDPMSIPASQYSSGESDSEDEKEGVTKHADGRLSVDIPAKPSVVDRLSLSRQRASATTITTGPMAFHTSSSTPGFKVPSLLRRATSTSLAASTTGATTAVDVGVRRGGSNKSNIHYQAREAERKRVLEAAERKRKEGVRREVVGKGRRSVLGALGGNGSGFD